MLEQVSIREKKVATITDRLLAATHTSIQARVDEVRLLVEEGISKLRHLLNQKAPVAKAELHRHVNEVRMSPASDGQNWLYIAEGEVDLLGSDFGLDSRRRVLDRRLEMVAGVRFELTTFGL